ncbi:MAG: class I SAM-dependent methyltransferase, partial [Acidimicrobiales bacterium]
MSALNPDYDNDPERSRSFRTGWQEDVHAPVADRLIAEGTDSVLDVGCGIGRFATALGGRLDWIGLDASPRQIADCPYRPAILGDATRLALAD